jgi:hypothetical protein
LLILVDRELKLASVVLVRDLADLLDVLGHSTGGPAEFEEQRRGFCPFLFRGARAVDDVHLHLVHDFHRRDGDAAAHHFGARCGAVADRWEGAHGDRSLLGDDGELERDLRHDAKSTLTAYEESSKIVPCGGLARAAAGLDHAAVGQHDCQVDNPVAHGAVADGVGPRAACADHSADHGRGTWVYGEEEARVFDLFVEGHPADGGLDCYVHVVWTQVNDLVHVAHVNADSAEWS